MTASFSLFAFRLVKIISACKNRNTGAVLQVGVPAIGVSAAGTFLFHRSLAVSAFSLAKIVI